MVVSSGAEGSETTGAAVTAAALFKYLAAASAAALDVFLLLFGIKESATMCRTSFNILAMLL